jgi:hypothetical protein
MTKKLDQKLSVAQLVPTVVSVSLVAIEWTSVLRCTVFSFMSVETTIKSLCVSRSASWTFATCGSSQLLGKLWSVNGVPSFFLFWKHLRLSFSWQYYSKLSLKAWVWPFYYLWHYINSSFLWEAEWKRWTVIDPGFKELQL